MLSPLIQSLRALFLLGASAIAFQLGSSTQLFVLVALGVTRDELDGPPARPAAWLAALIAGSLALQAIPWFAALIHRGGVAARLRLVRPRPGSAPVTPLILGTLACWALGAALVLTAARWLPAPAQGLVDLAHDLAAAPLGWKAALVLTATLTSAAGDELLFRGFLQSVLLERWPPAITIAISSLASALVRGSVSQFLITLPLAVWFGLLAARTGSVLPGMLCHALTNLAGWLAVLGGALDGHAGARPLIACGIAATLGLVALAAARRSGRATLTSAAPARSRTASPRVSR
jgi:membrane protease YdiL (CAAX protease family)